MVKNLRNGIVSLIVTFVAVWRDVTGSGRYRGLCNTNYLGVISAKIFADLCPYKDDSS